MVSGEAVKPEEVRQKVRDALAILKPPVYILDRGSDKYVLYSAPSQGKLELIVEARSLGSLVSQINKKFDSSWREILGGYAAKLPAGKVILIDMTTKELTQRL